MPKLLFPLLALFLFCAGPVYAEEKPPSLVDRLLSLLKGNHEMPRIEVRPAPQTASSVPPRRAEVELARNFLPVYDLERGLSDDSLPPMVLPFFASSPIKEEAQRNVYSILVMIPDSDREAARAYAFARNAQDQASAFHPEWYAGNAFVFAPQFLNPEDIAPHASSWPDQGAALLRWPGAGWIYGADSAFEPKPNTILNGHGMSSYATLDFVLLALARREHFPDLERVVIAGAGGGGDFVQRYATLGIAPDILLADNITVRFVVANAYSYMYIDPTRAVLPEPAEVSGEAEPVFAAPKEGSCPPADFYPYGMQALPSYGHKQGDTEIRLRYGTRFIFYLAGKQAPALPPDTSPQACALDLQGKSLPERARLFFASLVRLYGPDDLARAQRLYLVPDAAAEPQALWNSPCGLSVLYGDGSCGDKNPAALPPELPAALTEPPNLQ